MCCKLNFASCSNYTTLILIKTLSLKNKIQQEATLVFKCRLHPFLNIFINSNVAKKSELSHGFLEISS